MTEMTTRLDEALVHMENILSSLVAVDWETIDAVVQDTEEPDELIHDVHVLLINLRNDLIMARLRDEERRNV